MKSHVLFLTFTRNTPEHTSKSDIKFVAVKIFSFKKIPDYIVPNTGINRLNTAILLTGL